MTVEILLTSTNRSVKQISAKYIAVSDQNLHRVFLSIGMTSEQLTFEDAVLLESHEFVVSIRLFKGDLKLGRGV